MSGRKLSKHHTWRLKTGELINNATGEKMNLKPQLLHAFSVDEMRDRERAVNNRERQLQAEVCSHTCSKHICSWLADLTSPVDSKHINQQTHIINLYLL